MKIVLLDYRKAFDLIDHRMLFDKSLSLQMPSGCSSLGVWLPFQHVPTCQIKISNDCFSEWDAVPYGVPQGTKLVPWLFVLMINNLNSSDAHSWKYVDVTTLAEVVQRNGQSNMLYNLLTSRNELTSTSSSWMLISARKWTKSNFLNHTSEVLIFKTFRWGYKWWWFLWV